MFYSFYAKRFKSRDDAIEVFHAISSKTVDYVPDMFMTVTEVKPDKFAVLIGCSDEEVDFLEAIKDIWSHGKDIHVDMSVWMALEAHHTRLIEEAHESGSEEDLVLIDENIRLNPDGTLEEV